MQRPTYATGQEAADARAKHRREMEESMQSMLESSDRAGVLRMIDDSVLPSLQKMLDQRPKGEDKTEIYEMIEMVKEFRTRVQ